MGGKSKPTIGYWYRLLLHFGLCRGPIDALLEFRGGERAAWSGVATGGTLAINARELWGGEKAEGGIEGELDVMLGAADQMPSARLAGILGDQQSAYRGKATVAFEGRYGAFNPYPKPASFKVRRIFEGWDDDVCWYPEKAAIPIVVVAPISYDQTWKYRIEAPGSLATYAAADYDDSAWDVGQGGFGTGIPPGSDLGVGTFVSGQIGKSIWLRRRIEGAASQINLTAFHDDGVWLWWNGVPVTLTPVNYYRSEATISAGQITGNDVIAMQVIDGVPGGSANIFAGLSIEQPGGSSVAMNPAHIVYDALTAAEMQGEPVGNVDAASFEASADLFFSEGFGLCARYNPATQTPEDFTQRICSIVGATLSRSRVDGKYYLLPRRGVHDLESLPVLEDDDILEYEEEPSDPLEAVNQVTIEWFDPIKKQKRTTAPIQALGAIQALGGVVAESLSYPEIPTEDLALRVGARDLAQKSTPLKRFRLTTNRVPYAWRAGDYFRLQAPRRGIADMVCEVGEIDAGTPRSGSMRLVAIQDVSQMPATVYVSPEPGVDTAPSQVPGVPPYQRLIEAPYVELAGTLPAAELSALADDAGFVLAMASRPSAGVNFTLYTAASGEDLADQGSGDWCPTAVVVEAAGQGPAETEFTLDEAENLDLVQLGSAALWGDEICRVDAIDVGAGSITLGRGCADTPPLPHAAGERIWFYDAWSATDRREYSGGEQVSAKLRTRTASQLLGEALAPTLLLELDERAARPYAPGLLRITDELSTAVAYPESAVGELIATWAHRDRVLQADQLIDEGASSIGPEAGTTYTVRFYLDGVLEETEIGITGTSATPYTLSGNGVARVEVEAVRDGLTSWQAATAEFNYLTEPAEPRITDSTDSRITDSGDRRITD